MQGPGRWQEFGEKRLQRQGRLRSRLKQAHAAPTVIKRSPPDLCRRLARCVGSELFNFDLTEDLRPASGEHYKNPCPKTHLTVLPITASGSVCVCLIINTFWRRNRSSIGLRSFQKTSWSTEADRSKFSTLSLNSTVWFSMAWPCILVRLTSLTLSI